MPHSPYADGGRHRDTTPQPTGRSRPRRPARTSRARTTGIATVIVSTVGIAMANTTGIAHSQPPQTGPKPTADPAGAAAGLGSIQAAAIATPAVNQAAGLPADAPLLVTTPQTQVHDEQLAKLTRLLEQRQAAAERAQQEKLAALLKWVRPDPGRLTQGFGGPNGHPGIDLGGPYGANILAAHYGTVIYASWETGYGNFIQIQHDNGVVTCYGHLSKIDVVVGQHVATGQVIGLEGSTGESTGPHLHFEVRLGGQNGTKVDPLAWLAEHGVKI